MTQTPYKRPVIGILANIEEIDKDPFLLGVEKTYLHQTYIDAILLAGGLPILLPIVQDVDCIRKQIELVDGLLLSGGYDVQPSLYKEEPHPDLQTIYPKRDAYELQALSIAYELKKPILGICRGLQLINVAFGGSLYQDVSHYSPTSSIQHTQKTHGHTASHTADIVPDTRLHQIFGKETLPINSFHHQAIKDLAPDFLINVKAQDGIIEGIEKINYPFLVAVQWHPEMMVSHHPDMLKLFRAFTHHCSVEQAHLIS